MQNHDASAATGSMPRPLESRKRPGTLADVVAGRREPAMIDALLRVP